MIVLGVCNSKDSGACLLVDGQIQAAANEERFKREKMTRTFPLRSIRWILDSQGVKITDIDLIGLGTWKGINNAETFSEYISITRKRIKQNPCTADAIKARIQGSVSSDTRQWNDFCAGIRQAGLEKQRIMHCYHQMAHAYTAFAYSPYEKALVITLDNRGDFMSGSVSRWSRTASPQILRMELELDSLGAFYGWITNYLGFTPDRHEGKVLGLSALGDADVCIEVLRKMIATKEGTLQANIGRYYAPYVRAELPELRKELDQFRPEDVAAGAQRLLEEIVISYARYYLKVTGEKNLCVAGGIFANVLLNMKLRELEGVERFFVFPHMGDGGVSAGAAAFAAMSRKENVRSLAHAYLGPCFDLEYCRKVLADSSLEIRETERFPELTAVLLNSGAVAGFFSGAMEYGPRALGGRSILVSAMDADINNKLNKRLNRTEFMPFAPVTLEEKAASCYKEWSREDIPSYYMAACYRCTDLMKEQSPAAVHIDGTARPQIINRDSNKAYYDVLRAYWQLTGIPTLINTSFNYHEEPIICEPHQAVSLLKQDSIDVLVMPPFIAFKDAKWKEYL